MEVVMSGTLGAAAEWKEDREKITKAMKRAIGMAGRIPYLCADQLGEMMGMIMGGVIGYYGRGTPIDDDTCQRIVGVQEYVARVRGFGTGRPHIMMYEDDAGLWDGHTRTRQ